MKITVCIGTYGDPSWRKLAKERAVPSALTAIREVFHGEVLHTHMTDGTLAEVRNDIAGRANGDWLCFLDADDELAPDYLKAMGFAWLTGAITEDWSPLLIPRVQYVWPGGRRDAPRFPAFREGANADEISDGNWLVIGTLIRRDRFLEVGGFEEWPMYEDWALFARAWKAGAQLVQVPGAVYIAHRKPGTRNHQGRSLAVETHAAIKAAIFGVD